MLPWLMDRGETPLVDVARHFDLTPEEVAADLELASMCGLPPFVDEMIDVFIDDDVVFVGIPRLFTRPLRLTAPEGFALVAAGRVAMQLPGAEPAGPLGRGLEKLAAALGEDAVVVDLPRGPGVDDTLAELTASVRRIEQVDIRYWTASRDEVSEREVTPRRVFHERGDWFVSADDHRSGETRTFRIDRVETLEHTGEFEDTATGDQSTNSSVAWSADGSLPRVTLRLKPSARWVVEQYPVDSVTERPKGVVDATFAVSSERWLERLLLRAGTDAEVIEPLEYAALGGDAARRLLARYA